MITLSKDNNKMKYYSLFFLNVAYIKKKMMMNDANTEKLKRTPRTRK
jgi:hypothetical protein